MSKLPLSRLARSLGNQALVPFPMSCLTLEGFLAQRKGLESCWAHLSEKRSPEEGKGCQQGWAFCCPISTPQGKETQDAELSTRPQKAK